jgi:hypothetical protein
MSVDPVKAILFMLAAAVLIFAACLPLWLVLRHRQLHREQIHVERMKAMEMGCPPATLGPSEEQMHFLASCFWTAFWLGAVVPVAAMLAAARATSGTSNGLGFVLTVWVSASAASIAAVVCATVVLLQSRPSAQSPGAPSPQIPPVPDDDVNAQ